MKDIGLFAVTESQCTEDEHDDEDDAKSRMIVDSNPPKFGVQLHQPLLRAFAASFPPAWSISFYGSCAKITPALMKSGNVDVLADHVPAEAEAALRGLVGKAHVGI